MRFSNAYSPAPVCSPTRISLQTGKSPAQLHWTKAAPAQTGQRLMEPKLIKSIPDSETTIGQMLQRAEQFMTQSVQAGKPFYIQLSWNALHASENANRATLAKYQAKLAGESEKRITTAAITEDLDAGVGKVIDAIDRMGLSKNTIIIYMSDNGAGGGGGGKGRSGGLRGGKGGVWEGGIRVPFIIVGPGIEANTWSHTPIVGYDLFPTFCQWASIDPSKLPSGIEGGSIAQVCTNGGQGNVERPNEGLVFHFPHYQSEGGPQSSIRVGDWKLIHFYEDGRDELYNLKDDVSERRNLAGQATAQAQDLHQRLERYLLRVNAQMPTKNPDYDPNIRVEPKKRGGRNNQGPAKP